MKWAKDMNRNLTEEDIDMATKHMRKCSVSLAIREIQIKTTMRYHPTAVRVVKTNKAGNNKCWRGCSEKGTLCTQMFIAAMSTMSKLWKEPQCPLKEKWIKKLWYIYTMEYYSAIRKDEHPPFVSM